MEIQEEKLEDILKSQREEYQRYLGVLAENFESQLKLVIKSLKGTQDQLIALRQMVAQNTEDIMKIQVQLVALREMAAKNTEDIEIMGMDLHIIKDDLTEKISRADFKIIEKRVDLLEKKFQKA
ncbi:hypothetical protein AUK42_07025 [Candidatus Atribacteria bacterium CG2_30_33_13]|uniref:Uncharacterized protein n=1 Tax=Candidatus Infernicultor aquiphilus TaxID=1805029 RepID=A0A1J5G4J3_9BACT|nr:MAG: hypothetical protein AUK42_07025 [Candidatus Atribacteria bacterium CG2_30_33_13]